MRKTIRKVLARVPRGDEVLRARDLQVADRTSPQQVMPGHFLSPLPDLREVRADAGRIFPQPPPLDLAAIDLNEAEQMATLEGFKRFYAELPFGDTKQPGMRYYYLNPYYSYSDGIILYSMIRSIKPKRLLEIGCGFSSCVTLDTNDRFFDGKIECTFVDPNPERLYSLLGPQDVTRYQIVPKRCQEVEMSVYQALEAGDILFIDTSHISKVGSDVNHLFFEVLPRLAAGVIIHIHDIYFPFEYPPQWIYDGLSFNEAYLLRAFLQYNPAFKITFWTSYLEELKDAFFAAEMPLCLKNKGNSLWLQKTR